MTEDSFEEKSSDEEGRSDSTTSDSNSSDDEYWVDPSWVIDEDEEEELRQFIEKREREKAKRNLKAAKQQTVRVGKTHSASPLRAQRKGGDTLGDVLGDKGSSEQTTPTTSSREAAKKTTQREEAAAKETYQQPNHTTTNNNNQGVNQKRKPTRAPPRGEGKERDRDKPKELPKRKPAWELNLGGVKGFSAIGLLTARSRKDVHQVGSSQSPGVYLVVLALICLTV